MVRATYLLCALLLPFLSFAQDLSIAADAQTYTIPLSVELQQRGKVIFYFTSKGRISVTQQFYIEGPIGSVARIRALPDTAVKNKDLFTIMQSAPSFGFTRQDGKKASSMAFTKIGLQEEIVKRSGGLFDCSVLTPAVIAEMINSYQVIFGATFTEDDLCGSKSSNDDVSHQVSSVNGSTFVTALITKDSCAKAKNYVVAVEFDLRGISSTSGSISIGVREAPFKGNKAASIKPRSDGIYAPRPLILMGTTFPPVGRKEEIRILQFKKNAAKVIHKEVVKRYVPYRGKMLANIPIDKALKKAKGKASFEISNGGQAYSVCFALKRTRQNANGYKN